jgi:hypothetical protein
MSTPEKNGAGSRQRTAGVVLLVLAAIAAVIGLLLSLNREQQATPEPATPTQPSLTPPPSPSVIPFPPVVTTSAEAPPPAPADADEAAQGGEKGISRSQVRVYNNSTIRGLAARAADDLSAAGWIVVEVGNYSEGIIPTTTVYYQDADQRADAEAIAAEFGMRVEPRFLGISDASPGIVVIVTNDYGR